MKKEMDYSHFKEWAKNASEKEIEKFMDDVPEKGNTINYTNNCWGHAYYPEKVGGYFLCGHGFKSGMRDPIGQVKRGDYFLVKWGGKIYKLVVAQIEYVDDPKDMFFCHTLIAENDVKI